MKGFPHSISKQDEHLSSLLGDGEKLPSDQVDAKYLQMNAAMVEYAYKRYPNSARTVMNYYWHLRLDGKVGEAKTIYQQAIKAGVILPSLD